MLLLINARFLINHLNFVSLLKHLLLILFGHISVVQLPLARVNCLEPLPLFLNTLEFEMNFIGACANNHFAIVHCSRVDPCQFNRDLALFADVALLLLIVNEKVTGQNEVTIFEARDQVHPLLDVAFLEAKGRRLELARIYGHRNGGSGVDHTTHSLLHDLNTFDACLLQILFFTQPTWC